ncbi:conserved hypothetical protein [Ricinus communis]|uniref:Serpin domain-containing protein n=1 Tax=Ricinus communis TaxID=3988 RepID=B9RU71_RICCO|nr:conserved hypothetical protein [Ricinus communis]
MWIPKLKFSYDFEASNVMKDLGLNLPFKTTGEFTETVDCLGSRQVYVSNMIQKSSIEVNEKGTEAAACTIAGASYAPP